MAGSLSSLVDNLAEGGEKAQGEGLGKKPHMVTQPHPHCNLSHVTKFCL